MSTRPTPDQRAARADALARIKHSTEMEGGHVTPETEAIIQRFVDGEIDVEEMIRLGKGTLPFYPRDV
ncbi:hypothetical protein [Georgenia daeguensis]|uniref:Antitoxin VbhA domain-containing protein n=1 Tax=Georgenia daeguensis TaxID=908355 RepID=A0ABP6UMY6_9MICO